MRITAKDIDTLGNLLAEISDLNKKAEAIKDKLKASGIDHKDGKLFSAVVVHQDRTSLDAGKVRTLLGDRISLVQRVSPSVSVRVTSRHV